MGLLSARGLVCMSFGAVYVCDVSKLGSEALSNLIQAWPWMEV